MSTGPAYRVLYLLTLKPGAEDAFLAAYESVRWLVARTPGHLGDQVCQSTDSPGEWLITSQWRSAEDFLAWERTPEHQALAAPMMATVARRKSLRYTIHRDTARAETGGAPWNDTP
ncbi:antibiotic biosynthesis monooxygenase family protein [Saccharomonospora piscinae]|uniref:Antibiotic biosynthesis monooxygenase n=1 Tax=Saccharomonospora piscinae TaxID=687388 RepID=A0A1V9ACJ3_SACPI|nr:antibiotic biosynthesis monooxygenase family protein [Saccharomonospora piscinae]OQO94810.1 antibiotic biosynthesis monooxygenase [Saccharomonospora piscinae]TLW94478.1 antibiotic biosynthesis monooxygenase [Saccharomonospora piscinae]